MVSRLILSFAGLCLLIFSYNIYSIQGQLYGGPRAKNGPTTPRWALSLILPLLIIGGGWKKKSLSNSGALLGVIMGFLLTVSNYCFMSSLIMFFITSSRATKYKEHLKKVIEGKEFKAGGQRNWVQVLCNGGMATLIAILYLAQYGSQELPINYKDDLRASGLSLALLGSLACCNGDTWASELGAVLTDKSPRLITTMRAVPRGTNGGVTTAGLIMSFLGGLVIGVTYYVSLICSLGNAHLVSQLPLILIGGLAGFIGSAIDSLLGATLQYSGQDETTKAIVENPGPNIKHISGVNVLDNHSINLLSSVLTGIVTSLMGKMFF